MGYLDDAVEHYNIDKEKFKTTMIGLAQGKKGHQIDGVGSSTVSKYRKILGELEKRDILRILSEITHSELKSSLDHSEVE